MSSTQIPYQANDGVSNSICVLEHSKTAPVILILPAMGMAAKHYKELAQELNTLGFTVASTDLRGIGNSSVRASRTTDFGYQTIVEIDLPAAIDAIVKTFPKRDLYLLGHSLGGQLSSLYTSQNEEKVKGVILTASCSVYFNSWAFPANLGLLFLTHLALFITLVKGYFPGRKLGFGGREALTVMRDWAKNARSGTYKIKNTKIDYETDMGRLTLPVLAINFSDDKLAPQHATESLLDKYNRAEISRITLSAKSLNLKLADHFSWLSRPKNVAIEIKRWVETV